MARQNGTYYPLFRVTEADLETVQRLLTTFGKCHMNDYEELDGKPRQSPGRKGEAVEIVEEIPKEMDRWPAPKSDRNRKVFDSCVEAARWLGCPHTQVGTALAFARKQGKDTATVRGRVFKRERDVPD